MPPVPTVLRDREGAAFEVRPLRPEDRPALDAFYDAFEPKRDAQGLPPSGAERVRRWLDGVLAEGEHRVVEREGRLEGHAFLVPTGRDGVWEYAVFLDAAVRGRGLGTALHRLMLDAARACGLRGVWLSVEPHNRAAIRSYRRAGFTFVPETLFSPELEMEVRLEGEDGA